MISVFVVVVIPPRRAAAAADDIIIIMIITLSLYREAMKKYEKLNTVQGSYIKWEYCHQFHNKPVVGGETEKNK
jgi:hypothetical protein